MLAELKQVKQLMLVLVLVLVLELVLVLVLVLVLEAVHHLVLPSPQL